MKTPQFNSIIQDQLQECAEMLIKKGEEYASAVDRLHNFNQAAKLQSIKPRQALGGFMAKHTVSIYDLINSPELANEELWEEKITDHINYLLLLKTVVIEESLNAPSRD